MFDPYNFFSNLSNPLDMLYHQGSFVWQALNQLQTFCLDYKHTIEIDIPEGVIIKNKHLVSIGKNTQIDPFVMIEGPCIIQESCQIKHGAYIRPYSFIGSHSSIGHGCELKSSILHPHAVVAHLCYVGDSIIGSHVNLSAGVKCANLRLDKGDVSIQCEDRKISTKLSKFGAVIGDHTCVGCNTVLNPGTIIGQKCVIYPLLNPKGTIPSGSIVKSTTRLEIFQKNT